jgi:hypothetical protein
MKCETTGVPAAFCTCVRCQRPNLPTPPTLHFTGRADLEETWDAVLADFTLHERSCAEARLSALADAINSGDAGITTEGGSDG